MEFFMRRSDRSFTKKGSLAKKFSLTLLLALGLILLLAGQGLAADFSDLSQHWSQEYVNWGVSQGLILGYDDGPSNLIMI